MESSLYWYNIIIELVHGFRSIIKTMITDLQLLPVCQIYELNNFSSD